MSLERLHKSFYVNKMGLLPLRNIVVDVLVLLLTVQLKVSTNVGSCSASKFSDANLVDFYCRISAFPNQSFEVNSTKPQEYSMPSPANSA
jgi:hypothetical protein